MIRETIGNLLQSDSLVITHQVNCDGVMGAGVAKQMKNNILTAKQYQKYKRLCTEKGPFLLGTCQLISRKNKEGYYIANLFGENIPTGKKLDTDYRALYRSFQHLLKEIHFHKDLASVKDISIAVPDYLGCGLAGGDWEIVFSRILLPLFQNSEEMLIIYYLPASVNRLWKEFRKIPVNAENSCIERGWHGFAPGTGVGYIYKWFHETFPEYF